jgi:hypothetical protein
MDTLFALISKSPAIAADPLRFANNCFATFMPAF